MKTVVKDLVRTSFRTLGYEVRKAHAGAGIGSSGPGFPERLAHAKELGFQPEVIFDCGACTGQWTRQVASLFGGAQFLMVEPNANLLPQLTTSAQAIDPKPIIVNCAVGAANATGHLNIWGDSEMHLAGASMLQHVAGKPQRELAVEVRRLDDIAADYGLAPDLVKLDLQGGELAAIVGAERVLQQAEMFIVEFGTLNAYVNRTTPRQLIDVMYDQGYCLYDVVDLLYRPHDGALGSGDFFFVKNTSPLRRHSGWD
jgi:FkbM family methyltransferase